MEKLILKKLIEDGEYAAKVQPHLDKEFFDSYETKAVYRLIKVYIDKYNRTPSYTALKNGLLKVKNLTETSYNNIVNLLDEVKESFNEDLDFDWLIDETELYCQDKAMENAIYSSVQVYEDEKRPNTEIKDLVTNALKVSFRTELGINFFNLEDIIRRYEILTSPKKKFASHLKEFNDLCGGGIESKALSLLCGDTHSGKSMSLVSLGASYVRNGYNVLYVTLEMSQEKISQLFEANFIKMEINDVPDLSLDDYKNKILKSKKETYGDLRIKEYPTTTASADTIRNLLDEYKLKEGFIPDIVIVDYVNLMKSVRYSDSNSYTIIKAIAEELRGVMLEYDMAGLTVTQLNRGGAGNSNPSMTDVAESYGLPATVDLLMIMYTNEELEVINIIIWKCAKNRFGGITNHKLVLRTRFEMAMVDNLEADDDGMPVIRNSEKTKALMEKMRMKRDASRETGHEELEDSTSDNSEIGGALLDLFKK